MVSQNRGERGQDGSWCGAAVEPARGYQDKVGPLGRFSPGRLTGMTARLLPRLSPARSAKPGEMNNPRLGQLFFFDLAR
jgi:hypothetical protein